nr:PEP-CTERM sorting domain-containing protein [uncultured Albidiferax sp.]
MLNIKKVLKSTGAVISLASAMSANAYVVGGIDFGLALSLNHLETTTLAQTFINGNNQAATSYGSISTLNGDSTYCAGGGSCSLYFITQLGNSQNFSSNYVEFTSLTTSVYFSNSVVNLLSQNSVANLATIAGMTPWLTLTGHNNLGGGAASNAVLAGSGTLTGSTLSGGGTALFDAVGPGIASVVAAYDSNTIADAAGGFADVALTSSFNNFVLNDYDTLAGFTTGCQDGSAAVGAWCYQGSSNLRGKLNAVPEPSSLALAGLGFGVMGMLSRRRRTGSAK